MKKKGQEHETYRLLRRKNLIIEAVRSLKVIEGLYTLQKKLVDEEKQDGVSTRVCKKSIVRLIHSLAREGFLKLYRTTVIQDGVSKKLEFVVHPSITADDPLVKSAIEQVRFKISSSYTVQRLKKEEKAKALSQEPMEADLHSESKPPQNKMEDQMGVKQMKNFKPTIVPGLSRSLGFQPKMPRFRMVHTFLFYLIYDHPLRQMPSTSDPTLTSVDQTVTSDPEVTPTVPSSAEGDGHLELEVPQTSAEEEYRVYVDELSWKRFVPPLPVHRDFGHGWALTSDVLISLPLSVYTQVIQINFKVDGLEEFLNDPVKQHYLVKFLPSNIKTQLLHRRKYFFSFYENLQRLCFLGLLQFGPVEKFMDKDQGFFYLKRRATIVDTTACEPHYNLAVETRPFDRRRYTFNSPQDVDNYWFDLLCVCLNTPLGVIRPRSRGEEAEEPDAAGVQRKHSLQVSLRGSADVVDDGVTPGDGQGAGGLDSSLFSHLKRNWLWTTHLLSRPRKGDSHTVRLRNLLSKQPYPKSVCAAIQGGVGSSALPPGLLEKEVQGGVGSSTLPPGLLDEEVQLSPQVRRGKKPKRKRQKKEKEGSSKPPKKKRKVVSVKKQTLCQDETDRKALKRMTRQRVTWTHLEDSLLMLCRVASHFLNRKIKKPFVAWNVVRDILHSELELSLDKTSLSVGRRSRYIMKNPQTRLNYRICLAEVYQDKALVEEFMNRTNNYEDPKVCAEEFNSFVCALRSKFSSSYGSSDVIIPDTKEELFNKFKVYIIGEEPAHRTKDVLTSLDDVYSLVLNNLIQSTLVLSNSQMKSCQAFQSFSLYSKYRPEVLQQAFLSCKRRGLVNRRRANQLLGPKKSRAVPFMPMSYQLSQHYYRFFTWRFPSTLSNELHQLLEALRQRGGLDRPNTFSFQLEKDGEEPAPPPGDGAPLEEEKDLAPPGDVEDMLTFSMDAPGGATLCCLSLMTLGLLTVEVSIPPQVVVVDTTLVDSEVVKSISRELDEDEEDEGEERVGRVEVKARQASHTNYLLMRGYFIPGIISLRNNNSTEHIAVNSCTVRIQLRHTPAHALFPETDGALSLVSRSSMPSVPAWFSRLLKQRKGVCERGFEDECERVLGYSSEDVEVVRTLKAAVQEGAEFGIDRLELSRRFSQLEHLESGRTRTLQQYIQDLIDAEELLEVGGLSVRLVCAESSAPWLLRCPAQVCEDLPRAPALPGPLKHSLPPSSSQPGTDGPPPAKRAATQPVATETASTETTCTATASTATACTATTSTATVSTETASIATPSIDTSVSATAAGETPRVAMETVLALSAETGAARSAVMVTTPAEPLASETTAAPGAVTMETTTAPGVVTMATTAAASSAAPGAVTMATTPAQRDASGVTEHSAQGHTGPQASGDGGQAEGSGHEEPRCFLARPWRIVDGSLNRPVCKGLLEALLLHIMSSPAAPEAALLQHYSGVLQPVVVLDLLQVLVELGCVTRRFALVRPKPSLFSRPRPPELRGHAEVSVEDDPVVFYEPTVDCNLRLSQVFPHETNWNKWVQLCVR